MLTYRRRQEVLLLLYHARLEVSEATTIALAHAWLDRARERLDPRLDSARLLAPVHPAMPLAEFRERLEVATAMLEIEQGTDAQDRGQPCAATLRLLGQRSTRTRTLQL